MFIEVQMPKVVFFRSSLISSRSQPLCVFPNRQPNSNINFDSARKPDVGLQEVKLITGHIAVSCE